jgi:DNA mismatch repair protein MSH6
MQDMNATSKNRYLRQLNIDKDLLTMRNFDVYDPMKRGTSVVLDGQTLAHVEVGVILSFICLPGRQ